MPSPLPPKFYELLRIHLERGLPVERLSFTKAQKQRLLQCEEAFKIFVARPWTNMREYFANRWGHSRTEIVKDMAIINFMSDMQNKGTRAMDELKVRAVADKAIADGAQSGDTALAIKGAALLTKVARLDQPEQEEEKGELLAGMPIVITSNPSQKYKGKRAVSEEEMEAIRNRWGVKEDQWQEMIKNSEGVYVPADETNTNE